MELGSNGVPVMAIGGFSGSDPAPSLAEFEKLVSAHEIHYFVSGGGLGGFGGFAAAPGDPARPGGPAVPQRGRPRTRRVRAAGGPGGGSSDASQITSWVEAHFKSETVGGTTVYDLSSPEPASGSAGSETAAPTLPREHPPGPPARGPGSSAQRVGPRLYFGQRRVRRHPHACGLISE